MVRFSWRVMGGLAVPALGALAMLATTSTQPASAFPADQVARGEAVWNRVCAQCHGPESTDPEAPLLLRPDSLKRFPTAAATVQYTLDSMPYDEPGTLPEQDYWDVVAWLLVQQGVTNGDTPLDAASGGAVKTRVGHGLPAFDSTAARGSQPAPDASAEPAS